MALFGRVKNSGFKKWVFVLKSIKCIIFEKLKMPYKERLKKGVERKKEKVKYKVTNWTQYNQSLRRRGMISLYFPQGDIKDLFINDKPYVGA